MVHTTQVMYIPSLIWTSFLHNVLKREPPGAAPYPPLAAYLPSFPVHLRHSRESGNPGILGIPNPIHLVHPCQEITLNRTLPVRLCPHAYPLSANCHCERSVAISLPKDPSLSRRDCPICQRSGFAPRNDKVGARERLCPVALHHGQGYNGSYQVALGRLAQRLERLVHTEEVGGSNPPSPTTSATATDN